MTENGVRELMLLDVIRSKCSRYKKAFWIAVVAGLTVGATGFVMYGFAAIENEELQATQTGLSGELAGKSGKLDTCQGDLQGSIGEYGNLAVESTRAATNCEGYKLEAQNTIVAGQSAILELGSSNAAWATEYNRLLEQSSGSVCVDKQPTVDYLSGQATSVSGTATVYVSRLSAYCRGTIMPTLTSIFKPTRQPKETPQSTRVPAPTNDEILPTPPPVVVTP